MFKDSPLSEEDLLKVFTYRERRKKWGEFFWIVLKRTLSFLLLIIIVYGVINFNALKTKLFFWYDNDFKANTAEEDTTALTSPNISPEVKEEYLPQITENTINIPAINITAPITWKVENTATEVSKNLENGVIQISGTALPGEKGNIYVTGHSSNYVWAKGKYNNIFALLNKVVSGDLVHLRYNGQVYSYKVTDQKIVLANDLSVMQPSSDSRITLVTCWPVGTSLKRLVVTAHQIYPDPAKNATTNRTLDAKKLPSGR